MIYVDQPRALTIVAPLAEGADEAAVDARLRRLGKDPASAVRRALAAIGTVHFGRWVLIPASREHPAQIAFESNYDGDEPEHLDDLAAFLGAELDRIYGACEGYPAAADFTSRRAFLAARAVPHATFYRGHPELPVGLIRNDARIRAAVASFVERETRAGSFAGLRPRHIRDRIRAHLGDDPLRSLELVGRHRIQRRGRSYGPRAAAPYRDDGKRRGLVFLALGASIRRQFEFVQHLWMTSTCFNGLHGEDDPLAGPRAPHFFGDGSGSYGEQTSPFTLPAHPVRRTVPALPRFVTTRGGEYFFLPSPRALAFLGALTT